MTSDFGLMLGRSRLVAKDPEGKERPLTEGELRSIGLQERAKVLMRGVGATLGLLADYYVEMGLLCASVANALDAKDRLDAMSEGDRFLDWASERAIRAGAAMYAEIDERSRAEEPGRVEAARAAHMAYMEGLEG